MNVNIEEVIELLEKRQTINMTPIEQIVWHINGQPIKLSPELLKEWCYAGLSNIDIVKTVFTTYPVRCAVCNNTACVCGEDGRGWAGHCTFCNNAIGHVGFHDPCAATEMEAVVRWNVMNLNTRGYIAEKVE